MKAYFRANYITDASNSGEPLEQPASVCRHHLSGDQHVWRGFAAIPAYLKDLFGGYHASAIHGRLLTAWSVAGIIGPLIVNGILDHYVKNHLSKQNGYTLMLRRP